MRSYYRIFVVLLLTAVGPSCRKLVSVPPPTDPNQLSTSTVFGDDAHAIAAMNGVYTGILSDSRTLLDGGSSLFNSLSADELTRVVSSSTEDEFALNALTAGNTLCSGLYTTAYKTIRPANIMLEQLPGATGVSDSIRRQLMGEAKLVRALYYYYIVNLWGDVPLVLTSDYGVSNTLPRTSADKVYAQIIRDLTDAQGLLGAGYRGYAGQTPGRTIPNQATATAILARVYLYRGNWAGAVEQAGNVIADNRYQLEQDLDRVFLSSSTEAIWQLQPIPPSHTEEGILFLPLLGPRPSYVLTNSLLAAFETGDERKARWTRSVTFLGKVYTYPYKYKQNSADTTAAIEYTTPVRLAELYLVRAEAQARLGNGTEALTDLNIIRSRAGLPPLTDTDPAALLTAVAHERQIELFTEYGHRWLDLKRTGQADAVLSAEKTGWKSSDALYPFATLELQQNPSLVQNPGYH